MHNIRSFCLGICLAAINAGMAQAQLTTNNNGTKLLPDSPIFCRKTIYNYRPSLARYPDPSNIPIPKNKMAICGTKT